jgi:hypothetical protein
MEPLCSSNPGAFGLAAPLSLGRAFLPRRLLVFYFLLLLLFGCSPSPDSGPLFPTHDLAPETSRAALVGELILSGDCLRIVSRDDGHRYLPLWPRGYSLTKDDVKVSVRDSSGKTVGQTGTGIYASGRQEREVSHLLDPELRARVHARCPGPYWVVSEEVAIYVTAMNRDAASTQSRYARFTRR